MWILDEKRPSTTEVPVGQLQQLFQDNSLYFTGALSGQLGISQLRVQEIWQKILCSFHISFELFRPVAKQKKLLEFAQHSLYEPNRY